MKTEHCIHCGKPIKSSKNHCECFQCRCVQRVFGKSNPPVYKEKQAIKHLNKKGPGLLRQIFNF
jgi:hypothetical protein